ncbi:MULTISPECIES: ABC transporter permease [Kitasatospora]|uniref:Transport permease protein n=2 Tax=Kitasatospora TaxID=2063 RepID=A0ABT1J3I6_9ACTN|nr:ABC transporter permease [Kitasatospora paracochleata]MCP2311987.1 ABC-2 type transport system permease protein [Kitasatospora paracochleata]
MTTPTVSVPLAVLKSEARLLRREPASIFWIAVFPTLLLVVLGLIPAFRDPSPALGGRRTIDLYVPVSVLLALIISGLQAMPQVISAYRERGILRRMATTPIRPAALLTAQIALHGAVALGSAALVVAVGRIAFDVPLPGRPLGYLLALALAALAALALGSTIAALTRTTRICAAVSSVVFFPTMFTAGVWLPVQQMPALLQRVVEVAPFGAAAQALSRASAGDWPGWMHLGVLAAWAIVLLGAAARWFRWE